jgi:type IV pilus assembly protein PilB
VYEIIPITEELVNNIKDKKLEINQYLKENNIATLKTNMIQLVKEGITSVEEVYPFLI